MDIFALGACHITVFLGILWLIVMSIQYKSLTKKLDYYLSMMSLVGLIGFAVTQIIFFHFSWFQMKLFAQGFLGFMLSCQLSLLVWNVDEGKSRKKQSVLIKLPILFAIGYVIVFQHYGKIAHLAAMVSTLALALGFLAKHRHYHRLIFRFYFFFTIFMGLALFFHSFYSRHFMINFAESVFFVLALIFYYQTISFTLAGVYTRLKLV